ncbi:hypothetical protein IC9_02113 [Bacillus toyonensis]|nr:hypothetical protein Btoyo_0694 [Bacillus toyonensis BCT-7112]EJQ87402.1 hypothetical protein IGO_03171 [Bacillus toyonensis]MDF9886432.1 hypothetical protein [Bacillus sp. LEw-kw-24]MDH6555379.1 hypothetical protein [Bacillus sp. LEw-kw-2]MDH8705910.1 hypothetical protein [Stenotrophomonas sp. 1198]MDP9746795.1 hypothetical protein [Bacillus thuringiensis]
MKLLKKVSACLLLSLLVVTSMFSTTNRAIKHTQKIIHMMGKVLTITAVINPQ